MERMTSRDEDCVLVNGHALGYATIGELVQMAERLAAYEDMDSKRLRPGDTVWLSKMFYTRPKKPVPVTVDAIRCAELRTVQLREEDYHDWPDLHKMQNRI